MRQLKLLVQVVGVVLLLLLLPFKKVRAIPIRLAEKLGALSVRNRAYALGYIALVFFLIPLFFILV